METLIVLLAGVAPVVAFAVLELRWRRRAAPVVAPVSRTRSHRSPRSDSH